MIGIRLGIGFGGSSRVSWASYWANQTDVFLFFGQIKNISGGSLANEMSGSSDALTVTGAAGSYTFQCPNNATYIAADTDYIWFETDEDQRTLTEAEMIGYDFERTIVFYDDASPYTLRAIAILKPLQSVTDKMRDDFHLSIWWDNTLSAYGNLKGNRGVGQSVWLNDKYLAVYNALTTKPSDPIAGEQSRFVKKLVNGGVLAKLDRLWVFAQTVNTASEALLDWLAPATAARKCVLISTPTFTALEGFTGDGIGKALSSEYNPTNDAVNYSQNSSSAGVYNRANKAGENGQIIGCIQIDGTHPTQLVLYTKFTDDKMYHRNNTSLAYVNFDNADARGMYISTRNDINTAVLYKNKTPNSASQTANRIPTQKIPFLCGIGNSGAYGTWSKDQISMGFFGSGLTQADVDIIVDAFEAYMDSNGKGVI